MLRKALVTVARFGFVFVLLLRILTGWRCLFNIYVINCIVRCQSCVFVQMDPPPSSPLYTPTVPSLTYHSFLLSLFPCFISFHPFRVFLSPCFLMNCLTFFIVLCSWIRHTKTSDATSLFHYVIASVELCIIVLVALLFGDIVKRVCVTVQSF